MRSLRDYAPEVNDPEFGALQTEYRRALRAAYSLDRVNVRTQQSLELRVIWSGQGVNEDAYYDTFLSQGIFPSLLRRGSVWEANWEGEHEVSRSGANWSWRCYAGASHGDYNMYALRTMGLSGTSDLLRDHLMFSRSGETFAGQIVALEQGGLALQGGSAYNNHPVRSLLTVKVARSLFAGIDVYGGAVFSSGQEGVVTGLEWDVGVLKVQVPLVTYIPAGDVWYTPATSGSPAVTVVFNLERLSPYHALRGGTFLP